MDYTEFETEIMNRRSNRKKRVSNSWGVYDAYKLIRKNKWYDIGRPLKEHEFYTIIREVNDYIARYIANGATIIFPYRMGKLELRKFSRGVSIVDGKLKNTYPINWHETLKLWFEDEEERKKKTLIRREDKYVYHIKYNKHSANYENIGFYSFLVNRFIKKAIKNKIINGEIDTLW